MKNAHFVVCMSVMLAATLCQAQNNPVPFVNQPLVPDAIAPGGPDLTLTVNGTGFVNGATVNWNGAALTTTFVNQGQVTATVPAADIATAGTAAVTVSNPAPGGGTSNIQYFATTNSTSDVSLTELGFGDDLGFVGNSRPVIADFNNDRVPDLLVGVDAGYCVYLGVGDGTYQALQCVVDYGDYSLARAADFNADGKVDLAWMERGVPGCAGAVLLGNGDGTFKRGKPLSFTFCGGAWALESADVNGDGVLDLVTSLYDGEDPSTITVFPGVGDGTFATPIDTNFGNTTSATRIALGDFNHDGKLDVVGQSFVLLGNGDGTFQPAANTGWFEATQLVAADINGDGNLDIVGIGNVSVFLGNGDGSFQPGIAFDAGLTPVMIAVADLNGDGKLDLAASAINSGSSLSILLGNNDGTFQAPALYSAKAGNLYSIALGDLNNDGAMDLVALGGIPPVAVFLQGLFPVASLSSTSLTFDRQSPGTTSAAKDIVLTNQGTATMTIASIGITGADAGDFAQTNTCGSSVAAGASCHVSVTFTPTVVADRSATLNISDNAPGGVQSVALSGAVADFGVAPNSDTSQTVTAGQAANYSVNVGWQTGFEGIIALTCSGAPPSATCTVTPASVQTDPQGGNVTASVAVVTSAPSGGFTQQWSGLPPGAYGVALGSTILLAFAILSGRIQRHRWVSLLRYTAALFCLISVSGLVACGGGSGGGHNSGGTLAGTYTIKVTGTYTAGGVTVSHFTPFTLVVK